MNQSIASGVLKGLGELGQETVKKTVEEAGKIIEPIISAQDLLGNISTMSDEEMKREQAEDERKKQEEIAKLKAEMGQGRDLESEIEKIRQEREEKERQEERVEEEKERQEEMAEEGEIIFEPETKKKGPGSGMAKGHQGKASNSDMSATAEYYKKPD